MGKLQILRVREGFPALTRMEFENDIFFDGPGGTQVPRIVMQAMMDCMTGACANIGGGFIRSIRADEIVAAARRTVAIMLNAQDPEEVIFGQNMTSLTFHMSRAFCVGLKSGDEIVLSRVDHDANVSPWIFAARERGAVIRWLDLSPATYDFNREQAVDLISERTRIVALGLCSNVTGTIADIDPLLKAAKRQGALVYLDAVQFAPHRLMDVQSMPCDALVFDSYKCFGPHQAVLWLKADVRDALEAYNVAASSGLGADRFETGTPNIEGIAGVAASVEYLCGLAGMESLAPEDGRCSPVDRSALVRAYALIDEHEATLSRQLIRRLTLRKEINMVGKTDPADVSRRVPVMSFFVDGWRNQDLADHMIGNGVACWYGTHYASHLGPSLKLRSPRLLRIGAVHYNTVEEVDRVCDIIDSFFENVHVLTAAV